MATPDQIRDAFINSDCWILAHHITTTYQGFIPIVLTDGTAAWDHALVYRAATDTYVDAAGEHTFQDLCAAWDHLSTWDHLETMRPGDFHGLTRAHPEINPAEAVALLEADGVDFGAKRPQD